VVYLWGSGRGNAAAAKDSKPQAVSGALVGWLGATWTRRTLAFVVYQPGEG